jgi:hypothetical protein
VSCFVGVLFVGCCVCFTCCHGCPMHERLQQAMKTKMRSGDRRMLVSLLRFVWVVDFVMLMPAPILFRSF